jgi:(2Fe-2S) ferredoxin
MSAEREEAESTVGRRACRRVAGETPAIRPSSTAFYRHVRVNQSFMAQIPFITDTDRLLNLAPVAAAPITHHVFVCTGTSCSAVDSAEVKATFERELLARGILFGKEKKGKNPRGNIVLTECASVGFCAIGPAVMVYPDGVWYAQVRSSDVAEIIEEHILNGRVVERLALLRVPSTGATVDTESETKRDWEV